jgi:hypothetical protein
MKVCNIIYAAFFFLLSCVSEKEKGLNISDATLFDQAKNASSFFYYKNSSDTLNTAPVSPHFAYVRIRFNPKATTAMNDSVSNLTETQFPEESMIVKEVYTAPGGPLESYEIMYKKSGAANSASGWIWSELKSDGSVIYSAVNKGEQCASCHAQPTNSDLVRTFSLH